MRRLVLYGPRIRRYECDAEMDNANFKDGSEYEMAVDGARGDPDSPLTWEEVLGKFKELAVPLLPEERARAIAETVSGIENVGSLEELSGLLQG